MRSTTRLMILVVLASGLLMAGLPIAAAAQGDTGRLGQFVEATGYPSKHPAPQVWIVTVPGEGASPREVLVGTSNGIVVVGTIVARKAEMRLNEDMLTKLLRYNHQLDRVKVAIDDDGDLAIRVDLTLRLLDAADLKDVVTQVARAGETVRTGIADSLQK